MATKRTTDKTNASEVPTSQPATETPKQPSDHAPRAGKNTIVSRLFKEESTAPKDAANSDSPPLTVRQKIFYRLFAPGDHERQATEKFIESINWRDKYKPSFEEMWRAKDVAEWVAAAIMGGKEEQWKRLTNAWYVLNDLETKAKRVARAAAKVDRLLYRSAAMEDDGALERIAIEYRNELAFIDSRFAELKTDDVARVIKGVAKARPDNPEKYREGGAGNDGAFGILAKFCFLCGAFDAEKRNPFAGSSQSQLTIFIKNLRSHYKNSGRKPLEFEELFVPGRKVTRP